METPAKRWLVVLGAVINVLGASSYNLNISPRHLRINNDSIANVTIQCTADVPLTACQMSWWAEKASPGPVLDLGPGSRPTVEAPGLLGYSYAGRGLDAGDCGVTLSLQGKKVWTVGCRVQAAGKGWRYATMDLLAYSTDTLPGVVVERASVVVLPGKEATIMCSAPQPVDVCYLSLPGRAGYLDFYKGLSSRDSVGRHIYRGSGRQSGECGLTWKDLGEGDNGPLRCYLWKKPNLAENRRVDIIVARAPDNTELKVDYEGTATLRATCTVKGGRPAPDVQWLLGDDVVRNDALDDTVASPADAWMWPWSATTVTQTFTRTLQPGDHGKVLKCVTSHIVLDEPLEARLTLSKPGAERPSGSDPDVSTSVDSSHSTKPRAATACPAVAVDKELRQLKLKEAETALRAVELAEEAGRLVLAAAKESLRAEEARAREEVAWAVNAEEELQYEQKRRGQRPTQARKT